MHFIDFVRPSGIEDTFNTFRLGLFYSKNLKAGDRVVLLENKEKVVIGEAEVLSVFVGELKEMLDKHAISNHAVLTCLDSHAELLGELLSHFYGPHIALPNKKTTVIYLRRIRNE